MALRKPSVTDAVKTSTAAVVEKEPVVKAVETKAVETAKVDTAEVKDDAPLEGELVNDAADAAADDAAEPEVETPEVETEVVDAEAQPEAVAEALVESAESGKAVAVKQENTAVVASPNAVRGALAQFSEDLASQGYEGMQLTGMSFDRVKLHENDFKLGSDEISLGQTLDVQIMSTRPLYIVRQHDGSGAEIFYSYDKNGLLNTDGSSAQETLDNWKEDGYGVEGSPLNIKEYSEAMAQIVGRDDEHEGLMVMLSIPPASRNRLAGAFAVGRQRLKVDPSNLIVRCKVGNKIGSGEEAFRPWVFTAHRVAEAAE